MATRLVFCLEAVLKDRSQKCIDEFSKGTQWYAGISRGMQGYPEVRIGMVRYASGSVGFVTFEQRVDQPMVRHDDHTTPLT